MAAVRAASWAEKRPYFRRSSDATRVFSFLTSGRMVERKRGSERAVKGSRSVLEASRGRSRVWIVDLGYRSMIVTNLSV